MADKRKHLCKYLISSSCRIRGKYENEFIKIKDSYDRSQLYFTHSDTPIARNFYVLEITIEEETSDDLVINTYDGLSRIYSTLFSVHFGKTFYDHGLLESKGIHYVPKIELPNNIYYELAPFNSSPRMDACGENSWESISNIERFFCNEFLEGITEKMNIYLVASRHYWLSLNQILDDPDIAYINLVTSIEILSSNFQFTDVELFDEDTRRLFAEIENLLDDGETKVKSIRQRFFQVKRKYMLTVIRLIDERFYSSSPYKGRKIDASNLETLVKKAYDLRSGFLHSGCSFGHHTVVRPDLGDECGNPWSDNFSTQTKNILKSSPRYMGMERIVHYCLYNYLQKYLLP